ncbi:MAG: hypothetical protein F6J98_41840 [Moorea sp. SIO4G2]|nr:hypothetical protein [Moorena sp. SIO4G2]
MANININDISALNLTGAELFNDSESFMTELSDDSEQVIGGALPAFCKVKNATCQKSKGACAESQSIVVWAFEN